jgi:hypothetical protein
MGGARYVRLIPWTLRSGSEHFSLAVLQHMLLYILHEVLFFWLDSYEVTIV